MKRFIELFSNVKVAVLLKDGKMVGKILAHWSKSHVCRVSIYFFRRNIGRLEGKAGGGGYDKYSAAVWDALNKAGLDDEIKVEPGAGQVEQSFELAGYTYLDVV